MTHHPRRRRRRLAATLLLVTVSAPDRVVAARGLGDPALGTATIVLRDVQFSGFAIAAAADDDSGADGGVANTVELRINRLERVGSLTVAEGDGATALQLAAGGDGIVAMDPPTSARPIVLQVTSACFVGLDITGLPFLNGVLDAGLNDALDFDQATGFQPNLEVGLANIYGALGGQLVIGELRADVADLAMVNGITLRAAGVEAVPGDRVPPTPCA